MAIDSFLDFGCGGGKYSPKPAQTQDQLLVGEALDATYPGTFHVKTFTFSITQKGTAAVGSGLGAGKAEFEDFEFTIDTQYGCARLMKHCALGTCFDRVVLHVRKAGGGQREYLQYIFGNCIISSYSTSGDEESTDTIKFNYRSVAARYYPQKKDDNEGVLDLSMSNSYGSYDLKSNTEWTKGVPQVSNMAVEPTQG